MRLRTLVASTKKEDWDIDGLRKILNFQIEK